MTDYRIEHDWSGNGIDWRDESKDAAMAKDWLRAVHRLDSAAGDDVLARVFELMESNLDPPRGWRLAKQLVEYASDDTEFFQIGNRVLPMLLKWHEDLVGDELAELVRTNPKYRRAMKGQISPYVVDFVKRRGLRPGG